MTFPGFPWPYEPCTGQLKYSLNDSNKHNIQSLYHEEYDSAWENSNTCHTFMCKLYFSAGVDIKPPSNVKGTSSLLFVHIYVCILYIAVWVNIDGGNSLPTPVWSILPWLPWLQRWAINNIGRMIYVYSGGLSSVHSAHTGRMRRMKGEETIKSEERESERTQRSGPH